MAYESDASVGMGVARVERRAAAQPRRRRLSRLMEMTLILYLTIAILLFLNPRPVSDWLADLPQNAVTVSTRKATDAIADLSERWGLLAPHDAARAAFLKSIARNRETGRR
jgi:hypothetical protein